MSNVVSKSVNEGVLYLEASADLSAAGAVTATHGTGWTIVSGGAGVYTCTWSNPNAEIMTEQLAESADLNGTPGTAFWAKVISVTQNVASPGLQSTPIVVVINTLSNAATPAATQISGGGTARLILQMAIRTTKLVSPI